MEVQSLLNKYGLRLAALGTGAGWLRKQLSLTSSDSAVQQQAFDFIASIIDVAGQLGVPAIIGSMQGRAASAAERPACLELLGQQISRLAQRAGERCGVPLLIEPLNRYETNLLNEVIETASWIKSLPTTNLKILADLFHMNIEEADMAQSIRAGWIVDWSRALCGFQSPCSGDGALPSSPSHRCAARYWLSRLPLG